MIGTDRRALDGGDDPIGPAYWQIWYTSSLDLPGHGIRLADAGRLFGLVFGLSPTASQQLGDTLLSDLRQAENSPDAAVQLLGVLSRGAHPTDRIKLDIDDSATTAEAASIDIPTLQLIFWVLLRGALMQRLARSSVPQESPVYLGYASQPDRLQAGSLNCSEIYGDADVTYWTNWLVNKAFGGVQLPGMQKALPGLLAQVLGELGAAEDTVATINKTMGWANAVGSAISLMMQLSSMEVVGVQNPDKLERTKTIRDGKEATITWRLMSNPDDTEDGDKARQCFISYVSNILGLDFRFRRAAEFPGQKLPLALDRISPIACCSATANNCEAGRIRMEKRSC